MSKLDEIVEHKRMELAQLKERKPLASLEQALQDRPPMRGFRKAISRPGHFNLIAEIKRASPSAGSIRPEVDATEMALTYAEAGAQALSVLTDTRFFSGSLTDLISVRKKVALPVLRKDFLLEEYQVLESAAVGADGLLLIVGILKPPLLRRLIELARDLSVDALVEVHTERELGEALDQGAEIIGINNRDLNSFQVDLKTTERLIVKVPPDRTVVSESGIHSRSDVDYLQGLGAHAVLIGEELMGSSDIKKRVKELMGW